MADQSSLCQLNVILIKLSRFSLYHPLSSLFIKVGFFVHVGYQCFQYDILVTCVVAEESGFYFVELE